MDGNTSGGFNSIGGTTESELRWSQWWVDHRDRIRKVGIGVFVAVDAVLLGIGLWGFTDWLALGGIAEERAIRQMTGDRYGQFAGLGLQEIQLGAPIVLPGGTEKIDILAPVENNNALFWAEVEYAFVVGGVELPSRMAFVLPGQAKYLTHIGAPAASGSGVELKVLRRSWHRADTFGADSVASMLETRLNIQAENPVFRAADPLATTPVSTSSFTLANHTAFGYYDVDILVLLYRGDAIVGANRIRIDRLAAGERRPVDLFWYQLLPQVTRVDAVPDINVYDPTVYRQPGD